MNTQRAIEILTEVTATVQADRPTHQIIQQALDTLKKGGQMQDEENKTPVDETTEEVVETPETTEEVTASEVPAVEETEETTEE